MANKHLLLRCPDCGYEYRPEMHGWAFMTDKNTKCEGNPGAEPRKRESYRHPFKVVENPPKTGGR